MSTSREALVDVAYLDDCEQYEPASKLEISRTCLSMTAYNLQSTLPLSYHVKGELDTTKQGQYRTFDIHQGAQLDFARIMVLSMYGCRAINKV